ncbi:hypothetical protein CVT25_007576 [Psilocybe cyanescens]|uniref:Uncharacterized protein n=1 Tax=Psilocybe cyanescens TaxID=93625 RepID=A0A409WVX0_PSICY|nr:hypothetical protein CVT25_007576 [Psilocybe cyanescens]
MNITTIIQHQEPKKPSSFPARVEEKMAKRKNTLNEAMHVIKVPIHRDVTQGALTTAEQDLSDSRRDRFREESLISLSADPPAGLSLFLSEISACKPPTPPSTWNNVDSIVTTSTTTRVSTVLPIYNENKSSGSTEKGIMQVPLTDSHSTIRSREISINDMIDTYIQPSQAKKNLLHTMAPLQQDSQDTPNADTTGNSQACREQSNLMTPTRRLSTDTLATSRPRSKSVKDKIRELEELAAKASGKF